MKRMATSKQNEQEETDRNHHVLASATVSASYNMLFQVNFSNVSLFSQLFLSYVPINIMSKQWRCTRL